jgi:hypothetical protein
MPPHIDQATRIKLLVRVTYFSRAALPSTQRGGDMPPTPIRLREPTLDDYERALAQTRMFFELAERLPDPDGLAGITLGDRYTVRSITAGSLKILVEISPYAAPLGLLSLAYAVATFRPRISAARQKLLLEADRARDERQRIAMDAAVRMARGVLLDVGPQRNDSEGGPDYIDLPDSEDQDDDELVEWEWPD